MKIISYHYSDGLFWFRINNNGFGLKIKNTIINPLLFSERYQYRKNISFGKYNIGILK
jgi:hypothetical protein